MHLENIMLSEVGQTKGTSMVRLRLHVLHVSGVSEANSEAEGRREVTRRGSRERCLLSAELQSGKVKGLGTRRGDGCTALECA